MKKAFLLSSLFLFLIIQSKAQLQNANWCFGLNAGVNFNSAPPVPVTSATGQGNNSVFIDGGSVSDDTGQLLFYTDGVTVWDRNNAMMPHGNNLYGYSEHYGGQKIAIVKKPGSLTKYYIFTIGTINPFITGIPFTGRGGVHYTLVDMALNNGNGDVITSQKNISLKNENGVALDYAFDRNHTQDNPIFLYEKSRITTALNADNSKVWLAMIADFYLNDTHTKVFYNFLVSQNGINGMPDGTSPQPNVTTPFAPENYYQDFGAVMKISPDGKYLCDGDFHVKLYDFSNQTGNIIFNRVVYNSLGGTTTNYGVEFSPNSQLIYFSNSNTGIIQSTLAKTTIPQTKPRPSVSLFQYNIKRDYTEEIYKYDYAADSIASDNIITPLPPTLYPLGIQRAVNDKVYTCAVGSQYAQYLGVINAPNTQGLACNYSPTGLQLLSGTSHKGRLPQWVYKTVDPVELWPKAYGCNMYETFAFVKDNFGNNIIGASQIEFNPNLNYNHVGMFPTSNVVQAIHYNNNGVTSWSSQNSLPLFAFKSGIVQMEIYNSPNQSYINGATGNTVNPPLILQADEKMFAESNSNKFIALQTNIINGTPHFKLNVHTSNALLSSTDIGEDYVLGKYNANTDNIFVWSAFNIIKLYHFDGNTFNYVSSTNLPFTPPYENLSVVQIDNNDGIYFIEHHKLKRFDFFSGTLTNVTMPGFNNTNIVLMPHVSNYTANRCVVFNMADGYIYYLDLSNSTSKKILTIGVYGMPSTIIWDTKVAFENDNIYLFGYYNSTTQIGNQVMPLFSSYDGVRVFFTKLNLQTDFARQSQDIEKISSENLQINISPNPVTNTVNLEIQSFKKKTIDFYSVTIKNKMGQTTFHKQNSFSSLKINISTWEHGVYYVEAVNSKNEKVTSSFIKL